MSYLKSAPLNLSNWKNFASNKQWINSGRKVSYFGTFGLQVKKTIVIFYIRTLQFVYLQFFPKKKIKRKKMINFSIKCALFGYIYPKI